METKMHTWKVTFTFKDSISAIPNGKIHTSEQQKWGFRSAETHYNQDSQFNVGRLPKNPIASGIFDESFPTLYTYTFAVAHGSANACATPLNYCHLLSFLVRIFAQWREKCSNVGLISISREEKNPVTRSRSITLITYEWISLQQTAVSLMF